MKNNMEIQGYSEKYKFLYSAISDISNVIKFLDTKVSIVMALLGIIINVFIICRGTIFQIYKSLEDNVLKGILIIFLSISLICICVMFYYGICIINSHSCNKTSCDSLWFMEHDIGFEDYFEKINKMTYDVLLKNLSAELYKLNDIFKQKNTCMKKFFKVLYFLIFSLIVVVIFCLCIRMR